MQVVRELGWGVLLGLVVVAAWFPETFLGRTPIIPSSVALEGDPVSCRECDRPPFGGVEDPWGVLIHYPAQVVAARALANGELPTWNPSVGAGMPLLAEAHSTPLSPLLAPFFIWPSEWTYSACLLLRTVLAAAGAFLVARKSGVGRGGATLAALVYAASGHAAARFALPPEGSAYALFPFALLAARRAAAGGKRGVPLFALTIALLVYSAHPELAALAGVGAALFALLAEGRGLARVIAGGALGLGLGALVVLPFVDLAASSASHKWTQDWNAPTDFAYLLIAPDVLRWGAGAVALAVAAVFAGRDRAAIRGFFVAAVLVALLCLLQLSPYGRLVYPRYALFLVTFAIGQLAGDAWEALREGTLSRRALFAGILVSGGWWVACDRAAARGLADAIDVLVVDLVALVVLLVPLPRLTTLAVLTLTAGGFLVSGHRVLAEVDGDVPRTTARAALAERVPAGGRVAGVGYSLLPNTAALDGLDDARAMAALFSPRYLAYVAAIPSSVRQPTYVLFRDSAGPLVSLLGVTHAIGRTTPPGWPIVWTDQRVAIAANPSPVPRAFVPSEVVVVESFEEARLALPRVSAALAVVETRSAVVAGRGRVERLDARRFHATMESEGLVVFGDAFAEGWRAWVDGEPARVYPVDVLFRGVMVPAGEHEVRFAYRPRALTWGILGACAAVGLWLALLILPLFVRREEP